MAEVPIQINGILWNKVWKRGEPVVLYGMASIVGLEVGGGPIMPPEGGGGEPGIPTFPIAGYPDFPYPSQPIYRPGYPGGSPPPNLPGGRPPEQPPEGPADENGFIKPPPEGGGWAFHEQYGWMYKPQEGQAGPKR